MNLFIKYFLHTSKRLQLDIMQHYKCNKKMLTKIIIFKGLSLNKTNFRTILYILYFKNYKAK